MKTKSILILALLGTITLTASANNTDNKKSAVTTENNAHKTQYDGSVFYNYSMGDTIGTTNHITGMAIIESGKEIHPPHKHAEEEFLMIVEGEGTWELNGVTFPAKKGDLLYAAPWDVHGIFNSGKHQMKFVIMKWNSKGLPIPKEK